MSRALKTLQIPGRSTLMITVTREDVILAICNALECSPDDAATFVDWFKEVCRRAQHQECVISADEHVREHALFDRCAQNFPYILKLALFYIFGCTTSVEGIIRNSQLGGGFVYTLI